MNPRGSCGGSCLPPVGEEDSFDLVVFGGEEGVWVGEEGRYLVAGTGAAVLVRPRTSSTRLWYWLSVSVR